MIVVDPFQLNYSILYMYMEVRRDEDGGLLGLLSAFVLQPLWVFVVEQRSDHHSLVVNWK